MGGLAAWAERSGLRPGALDEYGPRALARVWKAQHFSYWMTTMLYALRGTTDFDLRRQLGELESVAASVAGSTYLAEAYTGWPSRRPPATRVRVTHVAGMDLRSDSHATTA